MCSPKHSVSVAGVVVNKLGEILVIQRSDNGQWQIPGGILEISEAIDAGLKREIIEETGILVQIDKLTGIYKNITLGIVALVFKCKYISGLPIPSNETMQVAWLPQNVATSLMSSVFATRVEDALNFNGIPSIRNHDGIKFINP
ncbi:NUDIX hydrolase [Adhaeribacter arboris]|uniref:NUDIX hydrolase n=1 Tax=Adhaeribacter arboris TaxID=2072846 RepID=A0A2T2YMB5_9BACT|nr:NUDIX domain-containing protein [Adhaeribacter arboris]PSR56639.1 NUDIX hydrolase [Adhaeribacter arboris]